MDTHGVFTDYKLFVSLCISYLFPPNLFSYIQMDPIAPVHEVAVLQRL